MIYDSTQIQWENIHILNAILFPQVDGTDNNVANIAKITHLVDIVVSSFCFGIIKVDQGLILCQKVHLNHRLIF